MPSDGMIDIEENAGGSVVQVSGNGNNDDHHEHEQPQHVAQDQTGRIIVRQACLGCRKIKVRCIDGKGSRCTRCDRLDIPCEYKSLKRGRRPKDRLVSDAEVGSRLVSVGKQRVKSSLGSTSPNARPKGLVLKDSSRSPPVVTMVNPTLDPPVDRPELQSREPPQPPTEITFQENPSFAAQNLDPNLFSLDEFTLLNAQLGFSMDSILPAINFGSEGFPLPDDLMNGGANGHGGAFDGSFLPAQAVAGPSTRTQGWQGQSGYDGSTPGRLVSMQTMEPSGMIVSPPMDHDVEEEEDEVDDSAYDPMEDPIYIGLVSDKEAVVLLDDFMGRLNKIIAMFDPVYHTFDHLRSTSSFLFSTILCFSARFSETQAMLYPQLYQHTKNLLNKVVSEGTCNIGTIQALACFIFWSLPWEHKQTWQRVGHATRLGYQMRMHVPRTSDLPINELDARAVLDRERTWYCLHTYDHLYSRLQRKPSFIRNHEFLDPFQWLADRPELHGELDFQLCWVSWYMNLAIQISQLYDAAKTAPVTISQIERLEQELSGIRAREVDTRASVQRYEGDNPRNRSINTKDTPVWYYDHMHRISRLRLQYHPSQHSMLQCHQWAVAYLDTMGAWDKAGMLHTMHDIQTRTYLDAARHLVALYPMLDQRAKDDTMRVINNGFGLLENAAVLDASGATLVLLERFRELLRTLCQMP